MPRGRPRAFDADLALDCAMEVFWRQGYEGAALSDLTEAMGINRTSLYGAYGNKEELFRKALRRYTEGHASYADEALAEPTARAVVERLLNGTVCAATTPGRPPGCLGVQGALATGEAGEAAHRLLVDWRRRGEAQLRERFARAVDEGDLPRDTDPAALALYVATVAFGIAVQAASGVERERLREIADLAIGALPEGARV